MGPRRSDSIVVLLVWRVEAGLFTVTLRSEVIVCRTTRSCTNAEKQAFVVHETLLVERLAVVCTLRIRKEAVPVFLFELTRSLASLVECRRFPAVLLLTPQILFPPESCPDACSPVLDNGF